MFQGNPSFILAKKLAALKLDLKKWNEAEFGNVTIKKQHLWNKLNDLDVREETQPLTVEEKLKQTDLRTKIEKLTLLEEVSWRQNILIVVIICYYIRYVILLCYLYYFNVLNINIKSLL